MKITNSLKEPKFAITAIIFCAMAFSLASVVASIIDQSRILLLT